MWYLHGITCIKCLQSILVSCMQFSILKTYLVPHLLLIAVLLCSPGSVIGNICSVIIEKIKHNTGG